MLQAYCCLFLTATASLSHIPSPGITAAHEPSDAYKNGTGADVLTANIAFLLSCVVRLLQHLHVAWIKLCRYRLRQLSYLRTFQRYCSSKSPVVLCFGVNPKRLAASSSVRSERTTLEVNSSSFYTASSLEGEA